MQVTGAGAILVYTLVCTTVIFLVIDKVMGLRVSVEVETEGLDIKEHEGHGYNI